MEGVIWVAGKKEGYSGMLNMWQCAILEGGFERAFERVHSMITPQEICSRLVVWKVGSQMCKNPI